MKNYEKLTLIEGEFSNEEASEILTNIFMTKIRFHEAKNFSSQVRLGKDDEIAQERIPALKKEFKKLQDILSEANLKNKKLVISSEINISISEK
jgi:hypothetical protein